MKFGIFGSARQKRGELDADSIQGYQNWVEYNIEAEALGLHSTFTVEHHFTGLGQVSASINLLTYLAAKTTTLRLGTAVTTLPWHNPVLLAEQAATLDLLSGGRLDFGVGKGYRYNEFNGFNIDMEEGESRFDETLELILKAWTSEDRWSHKGRYWTFNDVVVEPATVQEPHPPIWLAAGRPDPIRAAARRGANLMLDQYCPVSEIIARAEIYRDELSKMGQTVKPEQILACRALYITKTVAEKEEVIERRTQARKAADALAQTPEGDNKASIMSFRGPEEAHEGALIGTLDEIADRLKVMEDGGIDYVLLTNAGKGLEDLRTFSKEFF